MPNPKKSQMRSPTDLRRVLLKKEDADRLQVICDIVEKVWKKSRQLWPYTPHDHTHCKKVEELVYELVLPDEIQNMSTEDRKQKGLSEAEMFLLLASVWLHDIGMCPDLLDEDEKGLRAGPETAEIDKKIRKDHHERSCKFILRNSTILGLSELERGHVTRMCELHRYQAYQELNAEKWITEGIHRPLLIAYLRLGDTLHIPDKIDPKEFKTWLSLGLDIISRFHWFKSVYTYYVDFQPQEFKIRIVLKRPRRIALDDMKPLEELLKREVQNELDSVQQLFIKAGAVVYLTVECDSEPFTMSQQEEAELEELLSNIELFDPTFTPNASSVIDNVLDQVNLFLNPERPKESIRFLNDYRNNVLSEVLEKRPCHVFLWTVSERLEDLLTTGQTAIDRVAAIKQQVKYWKLQRAQAIESIPKIGASIASSLKPILLYGYSYSVTRCLEYVLKDKQDKIKKLGEVQKPLKVYICEARTKTEYRHNNKLVYCDGIKYAEELKKAESRVNDDLRRERDRELEEYEKVKIDISFVPDAGASHLFSRYMVSKVLFGANGIDFDGRVAHTLGHLAIADMASKYGIPVYVIADSMKIGSLNVKPDNQRDEKWLTTDIEFEPKLVDTESFNPREDVVPASKIESIITEDEIIKPHDVMRYFEGKKLS